MSALEQIMDYGSSSESDEESLSFHGEVSGELFIDWVSIFP